MSTNSKSIKTNGKPSLNQLDFYKKDLVQYATRSCGAVGFNFVTQNGVIQIAKKLSYG